MTPVRALMHARRRSTSASGLVRQDGRLGTWRVVGCEEPVSADAADALIASRFASGFGESNFEFSDRRSLIVVTNGVRAMVVVWGRKGFDEGLQAVDRSAGDGTPGGYVLAGGQV